MSMNGLPFMAGLLYLVLLPCLVIGHGVNVPMEPKVVVTGDC